jgi:hypothetical protein
MKRLSRYALPILLLLAASPVEAAGESLVCYVIHRGDTAATLARRITGDARNRQQPWFQIMDPTVSRLVAKSDYRRIRPGWRACIIKQPIETVEETTPVVQAVSRPQPALAEPVRAAAVASVRAIQDVDFTVLWLGVAAVVPWLGWRILDDYLARRKTVVLVMRHFADRFVREFERPLIQQHPQERPVRAQLRLRPRRSRLEILLAPGNGRRYPNLSDHKKNVEYDVVRVLHRLADDSFVSGPLYSRAGWVVVPLHFNDGRKHSGVTCISSF